MDEEFLRIAIEEARKSRSINGYRVGAAIARDGVLLSKAYSGEDIEYNHAEEFAITRYKVSLRGATICYNGAL